jgi:hypothetical protein
MAHEEKFRCRVIEYKNFSHTFAQVYAAFGVTLRSCYIWGAEFEEKGKIENRYPKTRKGKTDTERLKELAEKHPGWYLREFTEELGITRKKTFTYSGKSEERRKGYLKNIRRIPEENRVYVDESGINSDLKREYGRAPRGVKFEDGKCGKKFHLTNLLFSVRLTHGTA